MSKEHELDDFGRENQDFLFMGSLNPQSHVFEGLTSKDTEVIEIWEALLT
jgi:hypothetical protein